MSRLKKGFGIVSNSVIRDPNISLRAKALYSYMASYADADTGELTVSINRIASECGIAHSTVKRILKELVDKKIIKREARTRHDSYITTLLY